MLTKNLRVTSKEVTNEHENEIWHNGYSFGIKNGAQEVIAHLQHVINDGDIIDGVFQDPMKDIHEIKMLIFNLWRQITLDETLYRTLLPKEMLEENEDNG